MSEEIIIKIQQFIENRLIYAFNVITTERNKCIACIESYEGISPNMDLLKPFEYEKICFEKFFSKDDEIINSIKYLICISKQLILFQDIEDKTKYIDNLLFYFGIDESQKDLITKIFDEFK